MAGGCHNYTVVFNGFLEKNNLSGGDPQLRKPVIHCSSVDVERWPMLSPK